jgi:hypothetical protein
MMQIRATHKTGYEVLVEVPDLAAVDGMIGELQRLGYRPVSAGDGWQRTPEGLPICPRHGQVMTRREKQGDIWFSHRVASPATGEELWCRGYPTGRPDDGYGGG